ncbi:MAG: response regulator [bacterium]|nr:response regulator [bacterium]
MNLKGAQIDSQEKSNTKILYVDDEHQNLRIFKIIFRRKYKVFTAITVEDALNTMDKEDIHILITDQNMPAMRGTDFLAKISEEHPKTVKIILSGMTDTPKIAEAVEKYNIFETVEKPFIEQELIEIFTRAEEQYQKNLNSSVGTK